MSKEWEPGDPLFVPGIYQRQYMIDSKSDYNAAHPELFSSDAARWNPEFGWHNVF